MFSLREVDRALPSDLLKGSSDLEVTLTASHSLRLLR